MHHTISFLCIFTSITFFVPTSSLLVEKGLDIWLETLNTPYTAEVVLELLEEIFDNTLMCKDWRGL